MIGLQVLFRSLAWHGGVIEVSSLDEIGNPDVSCLNSEEYGWDVFSPSVEFLDRVEFRSGGYQEPSRSSSPRGCGAIGVRFFGGGDEI